MFKKKFKNNSEWSCSKNDMKNILGRKTNGRKKIKQCKKSYGKRKFYKEY